MTNVPFDRSKMLTRMMGDPNAPKTREAFFEFLRRSGAVVTVISPPSTRATRPTAPPAAIQEEPKREITVEQFSAAFKR